MRHDDFPVSTFRTQEFATRRRLPTLAQLALVVTANFAVVVLAHRFALSIGGFMLISLAAIMTSSGILVWSVQRSRDLILSSEFQNALFAAALSVQQLFCLIVRRDGTVFYVDRGFQTLYPQSGRGGSHHLEDVLQAAGITAEAVAIADAVYEGKAAQFSLTVQDAAGRPYRIILQTDPIRRPQNYALIRAQALPAEAKS